MMLVRSAPQLRIHFDAHHIVQCLFGERRSGPSNAHDRIPTDVLNAEVVEPGSEEGLVVDGQDAQPLRSPHRAEMNPPGVEDIPCPLGERVR